MERAHDFQELLGVSNIVNHLSQIEYRGSGIKFAKAHNKMNNMWAKLCKLQDDEVEFNLGDYNVVSTNKNVVTSLKEGFKEAQ